jgi:hypothetical protein
MSNRHCQQRQFNQNTTKIACCYVLNNVSHSVKAGRKQRQPFPFTFSIDSIKKLSVSKKYYNAIKAGSLSDEEAAQ